MNDIEILISNKLIDYDDSLRFMKRRVEDIYLGNSDDCSLMGDINSDQGINILDVVLLVNSILNGTDTTCSDLNSDEIINILDIVLLIEMILE